MANTDYEHSDEILGLLWAAKFAPKLGVLCDGHVARLLGGCSCNPDNIWVQCRCPSCKTRDTKPYSEGGNVLSLTEFARHASGQEPSMKLFQVLQPGAARYPVPLIEWLRAANERMGGQALERRQLCVFWSGYGEATDTPNQWRAATIRKIDKETGACEVKYHDDRRKYSRAYLYLPLSILHFARCPPPLGAPPRTYADGFTPLPYIVVPPEPESPPSPRSPSPPPQRPPAPPLPPPPPPSPQHSEPETLPAADAIVAVTAQPGFTESSSRVNAAAPPPQPPAPAVYGSHSQGYEESAPAWRASPPSARHAGPLVRAGQKRSAADIAIMRSHQSPQNLDEPLPPPPPPPPPPPQHQHSPVTMPSSRFAPFDRLRGERPSNAYGECRPIKTPRIAGLETHGSLPAGIDNTAARIESVPEPSSNNISAASWQQCATVVPVGPASVVAGICSPGASFMTHGSAEGPGGTTGVALAGGSYDVHWVDEEMAPLLSFCLEAFDPARKESDNEDAVNSNVLQSANTAPPQPYCNHYCQYHYLQTQQTNSSFSGYTAQAASAFERSSVNSSFPSLPAHTTFSSPSGGFSRSGSSTGVTALAQEQQQQQQHQQQLGDGINPCLSASPFPPAAAPPINLVAAAVAPATAALAPPVSPSPVAATPSDSAVAAAPPPVDTHPRAPLESLGHLDCPFSPALAAYDFSALDALPLLERPQPTHEGTHEGLLLLGDLDHAPSPWPVVAQAAEVEVVAAAVEVEVERQGDTPVWMQAGASTATAAVAATTAEAGAPSHDLYPRGSRSVVPALLVVADVAHGDVNVNVDAPLWLQAESPAAGGTNTSEGSPNRSLLSLWPPQTESSEVVAAARARSDLPLYGQSHALGSPLDAEAAALAVLLSPECGGDITERDLGLVVGGGNSESNGGGGNVVDVAGGGMCILVGSGEEPLRDLMRDLEQLDWPLRPLTEAPAVVQQGASSSTAAGDVVQALWEALAASCGSRQPASSWSLFQQQLGSISTTSPSATSTSPSSASITTTTVARVPNPTTVTTAAPLAITTAAVTAAATAATASAVAGAAGTVAVGCDVAV